MRAQASAEFLVVISALLLFFMLFYAVYVNLLGDLSTSREKLVAGQSASSLAAAINYVYLAGPGATMNFTMPYRAGTETIEVSGLAVESRIGEARAQAPLIFYFTDTVQITSGSFTISNSDGVVTIG